MRKSFLVFVISSVFVLSGCSLSSNLESKTKLIEYEKCLEYRENLRLAVSKILDETWANSADKEALMKRLKIAYGVITESDDKPLEAFKKSLEYCKIFKP